MPSATYKIGDKYFDPVAKIEYVCTTPGDKTSSQWVPLGASVQEMFILEDKGSYMNCIAFGAIYKGENIQKVAKPFKLRTNITTETIQGVVHNYTYAVGATSQNVSNFGVVLYYVRTNSWVVAGQTLSETETVTPDYIISVAILGSNQSLIGDKIYVVSATFSDPALTGVTLLDVNVDGRAWAA